MQSTKRLQQRKVKSYSSSDQDWIFSGPESQQRLFSLTLTAIAVNAGRLVFAEQSDEKG